MKYVKYQLKNDGSQPSYANSTLFSGGAYKCGEWYVGYLYGSDDNINDFILNNQDYSMAEITQEEAVQLVASALPQSSTDNYGRTIYPSPKVLSDGTIVIIWSDVPKGIPSIAERLDAVELAIVDLAIRQS